MKPFDLIAFDADDTLWHNERIFMNAESRFIDLLAHYHERSWIYQHLYETETRNLQHFGYGIKSFALSMIESAVELTEGRIIGRDIQLLVELAKEMLNAEVELMAHVAETIPQIAAQEPLILVTKGDLLEQEKKVARSGLGSYFKTIEIVSHKTPERYLQLLQQHGIAPERFLMVGNSLRSDILPVLEIGASAVYIPCADTWLHERADPPAAETPGFYEIPHMGELPALLKSLQNRAARQV